MLIRVYYEDTDIGGVVYYANYLKFCERARSHLFFDRGMMPLDANGGFVVKELKANYIASATLGDELQVGVELVSLKNASLSLKQVITKDSIKIFEAEFTLVYIKNGKPSKIPERLKEVF